MPGWSRRSIDVIELMGNLVLAKSSVRRFPGLLIQGDALSTLLGDLEEE